MKTESSDQSNIAVAIGKRKEESGRLALSLQDVFSDSANLEGMQQKTSAQSETGQGKEAQLGRIEENYKASAEK